MRKQYKNKKGKNNMVLKKSTAKRATKKPASRHASTHKKSGAASKKISSKGSIMFRFGKKSAKRTSAKKPSRILGFLKKNKVVAIVVATVLVATGGYFGYATYQDLNANAASFSNCGMTLKQGMKGSCISELQKYLNEKACAGVAVDGSFGPITKSAVKSFQASVSITQDGLVGPVTKGKLESAPSKCAAMTGGAPTAPSGSQIKAQEEATTTNTAAKKAELQQKMAKNNNIVKYTLTPKINTLTAEISTLNEKLVAANRQGSQSLVNTYEKQITTKMAEKKSLQDQRTALQNENISLDKQISYL